MKTILCPVLLLALAFPMARSTRQEQEHSAPETELAAHMEKIEDAAKLLRKTLRDPSSAGAALGTLAEIESHSLACKALVPAEVAKLPEAERAAMVSAYRRTMVDFMMRQLELEAALLDGDADAAKAAFERFRAMEDSAHERFAPDEDG